MMYTVLPKPNNQASQSEHMHLDSSSGGYDHWWLPLYHLLIIFSFIS